jgi:anti-sigma factor RsiW
MNEHAYYQENLPLYAAGQLDDDERLAVQRHLAGCASCQDELELWMAVSGEIHAANRGLTPPPDLLDRTVERLHAPHPLALAFQRAGQLLRVQAALVQRELWPASAAVMGVGVATALISNHAEAIYFIAPLVAAAGLTVSFGPENDQAYELVMSTPVSPWKVLLARLSIVSGYNLLLALAASLALLAIVPAGLLGAVILGWLAPMAFLSALALLLALWIGTGNAIAISYGLYVAQYASYQTISRMVTVPALEPLISAYQQFWHSPALMGGLAALLLGLALWSANRPVFRLSSVV